MILDNLFETYMTRTRNDRTWEFTMNLVSSNYNADINTAYALGYIDTKNLPFWYKPFYPTQEDGVVKFNKGYEDTYLLCGYTAGYDGTYTQSDSTYAYKDGTTMTDFRRSSRQARYINQFYPDDMYISDYTITFFYKNFYYDLGGNYISGTTDGNNRYQTNLQNAHNFLTNNGGTLSLTATINSTTHALTLTHDDIASGMSYKLTDDGQYYVRTFIVGFNYSKTYGICFTLFSFHYDRSFTRLTDKDMFIAEPAQKCSGSNDRGYYTSLSSFDGSSDLTFYLSNIFMGLDGEFLSEQLRDSNIIYLYNGNTLAVKNGSNREFYPIIDLDSILKDLSLNARVVLSSPAHIGYQYRKSYATYVTEDNEFTATLITGDLDDAEFKTKLRLWQYSENGIKDNDFDPNSIPKYPSPDDDPDSDTPVKPPLTEGDNITLQLNRRLTTGNDFVTLYNLTATQLQTFGSVLYKSFADYDPARIDPSTGSIADNFYIKLSEEVTGTLDISAVINFIVSVRQYPFSVATLPNTSIAGNNNIYIGSGKMGIPVGSAVRLLTSSISVVDAGSCLVAPETPYNDFRDYYNTTVTCFLPYCGTVELNPIEVINNTLQCYYAIDFYTGECTAFVMVDNGTHQYLCATKSGMIGVLIPITATNSGQLAARHVADNARDSSLVLSAITNMFGGVAGAITGNYGAIGNAATNLWNVGNQQSLLDAERQGRSAVLAPSLSGGSGGASFMLPDSPYVQIRRGTYERPSIYPQSCGYPSTRSGRLSSFTGFTRCINVDTTGIQATTAETGAIKDILETGIFI